MEAAARTTATEPDGTTTEYDWIPVDRDRIERLLAELFTERRGDLTVGPLIQGAAFEIRFGAAQKVSMPDSYLTVDTGPWHFHLCINDHHGTERRAGPPAPRGPRRVLQDGREWLRTSELGLRLWSGRGEQMISVLFPRPYYDEQFQRLKEPQWEKTKL